MDELRIAEQAERRESLRPLGLSPNSKRITADQIALTGTEAEILALPPIATQDLTNLEGDELFVFGATSWFSETARLTW